VADKDDYSRYYRLLGLASGAPPEEIRHAFRQLARLTHPDQFQGALARVATARFQDISHARDVLIKYWSEHSLPPPFPGSSDALPAEEIVSWRDDDGREPDLAADVGAPARTFGPVPFKRDLLHHFLDFLEAVERSRFSEAGGATVSFVLIFMVAVAAAAPLELLAGAFPALSVTRLVGAYIWLLLFSLTTAGILAWLIPYYRIYRVLEHPFIGGSYLPAKEVMQRVASALSPSKQGDSFWEESRRFWIPASGILYSRWQIRRRRWFFGIALEYTLRLNVQVRQARRVSVASFWFEVISASRLWQLPLARILEVTDSRLRKLMDS